MRRIPRAAALVAALATALAGRAAAPALGQPSAKPPGKPAPERSGPDRPGTPPVIGCPSLANYRLLMRAGGPEAASARLADPKADHLGCAVLARGRITGVADRVALGGRSYDCASVQGTTACHWMESGPLPAAVAPGPGSPGR